MQRRKFLQLSTTAASLGLATQVSRAQSWPERPIKIVQGFAPGGNADNIARAVSAEMAKGLN